MIKKNDALLILGILLTAISTHLFINAVDPGRYKKSASVSVTINGEPETIIYINELGMHEIVWGSGKRCVVEMLQDGVRMAEADCPDKRCVCEGIVPQGAGAIVCLPNRLVIRWVSQNGFNENDSGVDVVLH